MYKVILFNHGQTAANGKVLLDTSSGENPGLTQAVVETKLNEAGSFSYAIIPTHPLYNMTAPLKVYVSIEEDGTEIFYGRILSVQINPLTKIKAVTCEGALAFLLDCELVKDSEDRKCSASDYFKYCINKFNEGIRNDANRVLKIGTINAENVSEEHTYNNGSYAQIQSVMKSQLLNVHDGFFRVRRQNSTGDHYIDWVKQVGTTNPQSIAITRNVISQNHTESGEDIFSIMRPIGDNELTLGEGDDAFLTVSSSMLNNYGAIIRSVSFDAKDVSALRTKATDYIEKIKNRLTITGDIAFVDFRFLDGSSTKVHVGDVFTHIEGYEGTKLTADSVTRNLLDAGKDKLSLKNDKELMSSATASGANGGNSTGVSSSGKVSSGAAHMHKFYHETQTDANIKAKNIGLEAEKKIEIKAQEVKTYADQIDEQLSEAIGKVKINTDNLKEEWTLYKGTEIYKNQDHIDQVCGLYRVVETKDPTTGEVIDRKLIVQDGTGLYQSRDGVALGIYDSGNLTGGMMVQKINGQTETLIKGDHVIIEGNTTIQDAMTIENGNLWVKKAVSIGTDPQNLVTINDGKVNADTLQVNSGGSLILVGTASGERYSISVDGGSGSISIKNFIKSASVSQDGKTLTLTPVYGDAINFRRATTLSGTWSGSLPAKTLTVTTDDPQGPSYLVQFEGTYSANRTNLEVHSGGAISIETDSMGAKQLSIPVKVQRLTGAQSEPETVYETTINAAHAGLLTPLEATENKRYNLAEDPDHIGYSYVDVNVVPVLSGTWDGNTLSVTSNPRGNTYQVQVGGTPSYSTSRTNLEVVSNGAATVSKIGSTKYVDVPVKVQRLTGAQTAPVSVYETTLNPIYTNLLTTLEVATNGTYNLANDDNHVGYSSVEVNTPMYIVYDPAYDDGYGSEKKVVRTSTTGSGYMQFKLYNSGTPSSSEHYDGSERVTIPANTRVLRFKCGGNVVEELQLTDYRLGWNAAVDKVDIPLTENLTSSIGITVPAKTLYMPTASYSYDLSADYNHAYLKWGDVIVAQADVPVTTITYDKGTMKDGQWYEDGWSSGKQMTVRLYKNGSQVNSFNVDASGIVSDAVDAVTVTYDKGTMKNGEWLPDTWSSGNKMTVRLYKSGSQVKSFEVDASGLVSDAVSAVTVSADKGSMIDNEWEADTWSSSNKMTVRLFKNGTQVSGGFTVDAGGIYNNGFNAVGSPTLTLPSVLAINEGRATTIPITASVANKTTGAARTITQNFSLERNTYTNSDNVKNVVCVNLIDKADANKVYGRISVATYWNQGARTAWLWRLNSSNKWVKLTGSETIAGGQTLRVRYTSAAHKDSDVPDAIFYTPDGGGGGGGDSYSHDMYIKCTNKAKTYPGSTVYNYTFVCEGAKDGLTTVGSSLHVHW